MNLIAEKLRKPAVSSIVTWKHFISISPRKSGETRLLYHMHLTSGIDLQQLRSVIRLVAYFHI